MNRRCDKLKRLGLKSLIRRHFFLYINFWCQILNLGKAKQGLAERKSKKEKKKGVCLQGRCCEGGVNRLFTTTDLERDLECPWRAPFPFSLSNHLIPCFFGSRPKKTKAIISIQFVPSLCMSTDRLSYFGHAPRGELWEAGGQINGYYHSHRLITEHLDPGALTQKLLAGGRSCCFHAHPRSTAPSNSWLTTGAHSISSKTIVHFKTLIYFFQSTVPELYQDPSGQTQVVAA